MADEVFRDIESVLEESDNISVDRYDAVRTKLESIVAIMEENIDLRNSRFVSLYYKCVLAVRNLHTLVPSCTLLPATVPSVVMMTGLPGRPKVVISVEFFELLQEAGYSLTEIARVLGTSRTTLWRRLKENNLCLTKFSSVSNEALDFVINRYQARNPNCGLVLLQGYLTSIGLCVQRWRIRESVKRNDPLGRRERWQQQISRRTYYVPSANSLWHIDGHHSLIRWRFVIHGGIDGFSRMVVYLKCCTNNKSTSVMSEFHNAVLKYGVPSRVRSDKGGENVLVCQYIVTVRGTDRGSHIAGSSTANQRIERLWRDVYRCVASTYHSPFRSLEVVALDPDNEIDLFVLHCLYLPRINESLDEFVKAWNRHPLRTERNWSPHKIWTNSIIKEDDNIDVNSYGIDEEGPIPLEQINTVTVPETLADLPIAAKNIFLERLNNLSTSVFNNDSDPHIELLEGKSILNRILRNFATDK